MEMHLGHNKVMEMSYICNVKRELRKEIYPLRSWASQNLFLH